MTPQTLFCSSMSLVPLSSRGILAQQYQTDGDKNDQNSWNNKAHTPGLVTWKPIAHKRLVHSRHDKVSDATTEVSQATCQRICSADDILVEEARCPHLTGHKATTEDTDEEAKCVQARGVVHCTSQESRYRAGK